MVRIEECVWQLIWVSSLPEGPGVLGLFADTVLGGGGGGRRGPVTPLPMESAVKSRFSGDGR